MKILMVTNVFTPKVGGVTRSIQGFAEMYRARGHDVLIVAPHFENEPSSEDDVVRLPAITQFYKDEYSLPLPAPGILKQAVEEFEPDIVHSHHPFLLGNIAVRIATLRNIPVAYTHHTRYEAYVASDNLPAVFEALVRNLAASYCGLCDVVIAPSKSVSEALRERGVETPIEVVPTGVDFPRFRIGNREAVRRRLGLQEDQPMIGHVGRLSPEKNLEPMAEAVGEILAENPRVHFLIVGDGPAKDSVGSTLQKAGLADRVHFLGMLEGENLVDAYHAMDLFVFASLSETQGMVLSEAMASGVPVIAARASGVDDLVRDGENGFLASEPTVPLLKAGIQQFLALTTQDRSRLRENAIATAESVSLEHTADRELEIYQQLIRARGERAAEGGPFVTATRFLEYEWKSWGALAEALGSTLASGNSTERPAS